MSAAGGVREDRSPRPWWLLLLPLGFLLHIAEEWWAGETFAVWTARLVGSPLGTTRFLVVNGIAWPVAALLTVLAILRPALAWFPVTLATVLVVNAALHTLGTLATSVYSPGLVTGLLLYLPAGSVALTRGYRTLAPSKFSRAVLLGLFVHAVVIVVALA